MGTCITEFNHLEKEQSLSESKGTPPILDMLLLLKQLKVKGHGKLKHEISEVL